MDPNLPETAGHAPPDWRGLCEELVRELHGYASANPHHDSDALVARARAALAQPEPEVVGPTNAEAEQLHDNLRTPIYDRLSADTPEFFVGYEPVRPGDFARAVLARWGHPAPAPAAGEVAEGVTDEAAVEAAAELIYAEAMEWAARTPIPHGHCNIPAWQHGGNSDAQDVARRVARAVLSRWGRPVPAPAEEVVPLPLNPHQAALMAILGEQWLSANAPERLRRPAPAPAEGEVAKLAEWLRDDLELHPAEKRRVADLLERLAAPPAAGEVGELVQWIHREGVHSGYADQWLRAADLLERQAAPVPVPVNDKPWKREGWCDEQGRCWLCLYPDDGLHTPTWKLDRPEHWDLRDEATCLPFDALPLPQGEVE